MNQILTFCLCLLYAGTAQAQCSSTAFTNATVFTTDNLTGIYNFSSPGNAQASDNARTSATSLIAILSGNTYYLKATGFNFSIPSYAAICGVTVEVESRATGLLLAAAVRDNDVKLIKGGTITGNDYAKAGDWGSSDGYRTYGGPTDLWGTTLTPADVNAANFGIAISARIIALIAALPTADIDHIRMKIYYNPILPVHLYYFKSMLQNSRALLEWKTTEEEDNAHITLQRANYHDNRWSDINHYELNGYNSGKVYQYGEIPLPTGKYV